MEGFTIIDAVVAVIIVLSAILAYSRGFARESLSIAGWIAAAVLAYIFAPQVRPLIAQVPVIDKFIGDNCDLSMISAFAVVFAVALVVASVFAPLFASVVQRSALGGLDQGLGFLFGVLRGVVLVIVAFVVYDRAVVAESYPMIDDSRSAKVFDQLQTKLNDMLPQDAPGWIVGRYDELVNSCGPESGTATTNP